MTELGLTWERFNALEAEIATLQADWRAALKEIERLKTAQRDWVGLTPADFDWLEQVFSNKVSNDFVFADIVCAIEAKLKEKNQ